METNKNIRIQVMMVGGRRCGKTSILAAMKSNFEKQFANTKITVAYANTETLDILEKKRIEINDYFMQSEDNRGFIPDSNPTESLMTYSLSLGIAGKRGKIYVDFLDYPGEWLIDNEHKNDILKFMHKSQVLMIAIDTPHMMEEDGRFNEHRNFCSRTSEMLKMAFDEMSDEEKKLVLFVPLKCERYFRDKKMAMVRSKTEKSYANLIEYFNKDYLKYEVAVTPIFTLGGAEFSQFERDYQTGEIKINEKFNTPEKAIYYFPDTTVRKSSPKYCEQPIAYLLAYIMQLAGEKSSHQGFFADLMDWILSIANTEDYLKQKKVVLEKINKDKDGYHIIQDPMKFR